MAEMQPEQLTLRGGEMSLGKLIAILLGRSNEDDPWKPDYPSPKQRTKALMTLQHQLGIRFSRCDFDGYEIYEEQTNESRPSQRQVLNAVMEFCETMESRMRHGGGLILFGRPGTGKDHLMAAALYWALLRHGFSVMWVDGLMLYQKSRELIHDNGSEMQFISQYTSTQILAISDPLPPKGQASQYAVDVVQRIVDRRYRDCKSTWATMNAYSGQDAETRLAGPIIDRLRHESLSLKCEWPSFRMRRSKSS